MAFKYLFVKNKKSDYISILPFFVGDDTFAIKTQLVLKLRE